MSTLARYRQGTLQSQALRNALRLRAMRKLYGKGNGDFADLGPGRKRQVLERTQQRYNHLRNTNAALTPGLLDLFKSQRKTLRQRGWTPPVSNNPGGGGNNNPGGGNQPPPAPPVNPYIQINSNGQLDLPYNQQFAGYLLDTKDQMNQRLLQLQQQGQQQDFEVGIARREADKNYGEIARQVLNQNAGRGMAFSSAYGKDVAENNTQYNNYLTDLNQADTLHDQGITAERMGIETTFNDMLRRWALEQAEKEAKNAGNLGYGKDSPGRGIPKPKKNKPKNNRKGRIGPNGNLQKPVRKLPKGKRWVPIKSKKTGKVVRWKIVTNKAGR